MFGLLDTQFIDFVEGQNESRLRALRTDRGISLAEMLRAVDGAMRAVNTPDPLVGQLTWRTNRDRVNSGATSRKVWQSGAEYTPPRPQRTVSRGHLLGVYHSEIGLGFTYRGLKKITREQFLDELRTTVEAIDLGQIADTLERLFDPEERPLDDDGNGATPGFAGSGTGANAFVGRLPGGGMTDANYTHYGYTDEAGLATALQTYLGRLRYFHPGPYEMLGSPNAIEMVKELDKFTEGGSPLIRPGLGTAEALVDPNTHIGVFDKDVLVRHGNHQIVGDPDAIAIYKSYGVNNPRNPLAWRFDEDYGPNIFVEDRALYPLSDASVMRAYGVNVNERAGAVLLSVYAAADEYVAPKIDR